MVAGGVAVMGAIGWFLWTGEPNACKSPYPVVAFED